MLDRAHLAAAVYDRLAAGPPASGWPELAPAAAAGLRLLLGPLPAAGPDRRSPAELARPRVAVPRRRC